MAIKFNFNQFIKTSDAKQRILLIVVVVLALVLIFYFLSKILHLGSNAEGASRVAGVPSIASVQGGKVSPEYARALETQNIQKVDNANKTGTSAIPTLINTGENNIVPVTIPSACSNCCNACGAETADQILSNLLNAGKVSGSTADFLNKLNAQNLSPEAYEAALEQMVRDGKISPEEARKLFAAYKQNYEEKMAAAGASDLDPLLKQGALSVSAANDILELQKKAPSLSAYQQALERMVAEGKISPEVAQLLLQQYQKQQKKRQAEEMMGQIDSMVAEGLISPEAAATLKALQSSDISPEDYEKALNKLVAEGKISPEAAKRLLEEYKKQHGQSSNISIVSGMELSKEQGDELKAIQQANQPVAVFSAKLEAYARLGKISANTASRLLAAYQEEYSAKQAGDAERARKAAEAKDNLIDILETKPKLPAEAAQQLANLRASGASLSDYAAELQRLVDSGQISPETAQALLAAYKKQLAEKSFDSNGNGLAFQAGAGPAIDINLNGLSSSGNAKLDRIAQAGYTKQSAQAQQKKDYTAAAALDQRNQQEQAYEQAQVQQMSAAMYAQAQQMFSPLLSPPVQQVVTGNSVPDDLNSINTNGASASGSGTQGAGPGSDRSIIKAGSILYAVLDTAVDSDYAESPVMATLVSGQFKGAKLLGSIKTIKNGQRVMLTFNLMTMNDWPTGASIDAYAIDPDSARSALATNVDNHYLLRYGTLFASSFMQGLGQAVQDSGTTISSDNGVVTQSTASLTTEQEILVALGQVGQTASTEVGKLQNTPPTVKVKAGVGIGVLFMSDVKAVPGSPPVKTDNLSGNHE